jgi:phosphatidylserine/phosphatidylglycerophosphate/cardiolipin synthase-like enzyme
VRLRRHHGIPHGRHQGRGHLHEKLILIDDQTEIFGSHNLAWSSIASNFELSVCIEGEGQQGLDVSLGCRLYFPSSADLSISSRALYKCG